MGLIKKAAPPHATEVAAELSASATSLFTDAIDQLDEATELLRESIAEDTAKAQRLQARAAASQEAIATNQNVKEKLAALVG